MLIRRRVKLVFITIPRGSGNKYAKKYGIGAIVFDAKSEKNYAKIWNRGTNIFDAKSGKKYAKKYEIRPIDIVDAKSEKKLSYKVLRLSVKVKITGYEHFWKETPN